MAVEIKFCGITRARDIAEAAALGAAYVGVIFAGGPRTVDEGTAATILARTRAGTRRVGVFGEVSSGSIASVSRKAGLDIIQLHGHPTPQQIADLRDESGLEVWAVVRVDRGALPGEYTSLREVADAIVLDANVPGRLGGTGVSIDWTATAAALARSGRPSRLVLAGGLTPENVVEAIAVLNPDVVDVSSGVEVTAGIKDSLKMRDFAGAVRRKPG